MAHAAEGETNVGIVLLGGRGAGKSSCGNTILGLHDPDDADRFAVGKITETSERREKVLDGTPVTVVDTPSWYWVSVEDTSQEVKGQVVESVTLSGGTPPAFLMVYPLGSPFVKRHKGPVEEHLALLGPDVWSTTMVLFSRGDWLDGRGTSIEEHLQGASQELRWLLDKCGNRYHVLNNKDVTNRGQVKELLQKIREMVNAVRAKEQTAPTMQSTAVMVTRREEMVGWREEVVRKREEMVRQREEMLATREEIVGNREALVGKREEALREREEMITMQENIPGKRKRKQSLVEPPQMTEKPVESEEVGEPSGIQGKS